MSSMQHSPQESARAKYRLLIESDSDYASYPVKGVIIDLRRDTEACKVIDVLPKFYKALEDVKKFDV